MPEDLSNKLVISAALAGAFTEIPDEVREPALKYAAQSESFEKLNSDEKRILATFVKSFATCLFS